MASVDYKFKNCTDRLKLWERIEIVVGEGIEAGHYSSRFEDFEHGRIVISQPELLRGNTLLRDKAVCEAWITREDAIYRFSTRIYRTVKNKIESYYLDPPEKISRVQRRQFVRIEYMKPIRLADVSSIRQCEDSIQWIDAVTLNLSAGGVLIKTPFSHKEQERLLLHIKLFGQIGLPLTIAAIIRRVRQHKTDYLLGCEFLTVNRLKMLFSSSEINELPESVTLFNHIAQEKLVRWVFEEQVELRGKGLL